MTQEVHEPTDACFDDHCVWHNVDEPGPGYIICGECFHCFRRARDLRKAVRQMRWELLEGGELVHVKRLTRLWYVLKPVRASRVWFCPMCSHDF